MMNYHGENGAAMNLGAGNTGGNTIDPPPNTDSCVTCNSLIPDGCGTGTGILSW